MTRRQFGSKLELERELFVGRQRLQRTADGLNDVLNAVIGKSENELPGFDLRQIEHVIDESKQVLAVGLEPLEYAEHLLGGLTISAVRHQFRITQDGIERRAQLMTHIGEELRFMLARLFKLPALVLDLVEETYILNGNHRLVGEGGCQFDLFFSERSYGRAPQNCNPDWISFAKQRQAEHRMVTGPL